MSNRIQKGLRATAAFLFEPSSRVIGGTERRSARLLSVILLVLVLSNLSGALFTPETLHLVRTMMAYAEGPLILFYLLSRTRFYIPAAMLTIVTEMTISYVTLSHLAAYDMSTVSASIMWLLLPMFVAAIILPLALSLLFLAGNFLLLLAMPGWVEGFEYSHLGNGLSYVVIASILLLVIAAIRKRDVDQLHANSVALQEQKGWLEQEIEERRQAEMEVGSLQALINSINEAVLMTTSQGDIERINDTFCTMFGYRREQMINRHINNLVNADDPGSETELFASLLRANQGGGELWFAFQANRADGSRFPAEAYAAHIKLGGRGHFVVTIRDMTEHRRIETMKDEFISSVSHELRTPLTSIHGAIGIIKGRFSEGLDDKVSQLIDIAEDNSAALANLVEDILDISKLESGVVRIHYERCSMATLLTEAVRNNGPLAEKFHVRFQLADDLGDIDFDTDRIRFTQVVNNLLSNAAKYSPAGGTVEIAYRLVGEQVDVSVTDHGNGIPLEYRDRIFDKFFQVEGNAKQSRSGTGLGLSISRHLVEQMGGEIRVDSVPGQTSFHISLPRFQPA
jgi:PAS domain S-box-containing protein